MRRLFIIGIALSLLAGATQALAQGRPAGVVTDIVATEQMSETVSVFGQVVSGRQSAVAARVSGVAAEVPLQVGDRVAKGDVLASLDTELLRIQLAQAEAEVQIAKAGLAVAQAQLERAESSFRRAETLQANATISDVQLEDRASAYAEAIGGNQQGMARVQAAEAALARARYELTNAIVRAPFDGVVLELKTEVGQFVSAGSQVAMLVDPGATEVEANVPARFISALSPDLAVEAQSDAGGALGLRLRAILPTEFSATRTRPVRFEITGPEAMVAVGQSVTLNVPVSAPRDVLVVPKDALVQSSGGWSVFVHEDGKANARTVELGAAIGGSFEVLSGLAPGDEVVVRGNERLRPGQEIAPTLRGAEGAEPGRAGDAQGSIAPENANGEGDGQRQLAGRG
ncbi:efflux RND transporter periplasmic adaptor subunit [Oceanibium sediminis]|uniref:efflux RND transporter periplasmic adaptor subunit n=1 Tax=Oceanibium sediminis TaxID=2026339 RepID=UPI00130076A5|nr:efflux RND transporter periplasmic adaptor subunit [Oceanibium sediminis]